MDSRNDWVYKIPPAVCSLGIFFTWVKIGKEIVIPTQLFMEKNHVKGKKKKKL